MTGTAIVRPWRATFLFDQGIKAATTRERFIYMLQSLDDMYHKLTWNAYREYYDETMKAINHQTSDFNRRWR